MPERPLPSTKPLIEKLGVKPGQRILFANAPADVSIGAPPDGVEVALTGVGPFDAVLLFVDNRAEIEANAPAALSAVKPGGLLWLAYPKKGKGVDTDISRDVGWESVCAAGWETVSLVAVDDRWAALRFRPVADIPSLTRRSSGDAARS